MKRTIATGITLLLALVVVVGLVAGGMGKTVAAQAKPTAGRETPTFQLDTSWPKKLPNNWVFGSVTGINVDLSNDHVWVITRPREKVNAAQKAGVAAPPIVELDAAGNYIQGWGGAVAGAPYEWPRTEHGISVDSKGNVWIAGSNTTPPTDDMLLKFTKAGKFIMQIGKAGQSKGNTDTTNVHGASDVTYYAKTNEIFVADGYINRRVIVFDADTGAYKRMWSGFGLVPTDPKEGEKVNTTDADPLGSEPKMFSDNVHGVRVSNDGLVYVCDRQNQRVQVFTTDGKYITQVFISRGKQPLSTATGMLYGKPRKEVEDGVITSNSTASRTAFSTDPQQRFLYVLDRRQQKIAILDRKTLEILGHFGGGIGDQPGQFYIMHDMASDSKGNFYTAEINQNGRAQKFLFKGMSTTPSR